MTPGLWDDSYHKGVTHKTYNNRQTLQVSHCKVPHVLHVSVCGHLWPTSPVQSFNFGILKKNKLFSDQSYLCEYQGEEVPPTVQTELVTQQL